MVDSNAHDLVRRILDDLDKHLDPQVQQQIRRHHTQSATWEHVVRAPALVRPRWGVSTELPYPVAEAVEDPAKMLANELRRGQACIVDWLIVRDDTPLQVRPDFGIGLVASVFGSRLEVVENNPPWVHPLAEGENEIQKSLEAALDKLDVSTSHRSGWIPRVEKTLDYYQEAFSEYPNVKASIATILPDLQGPYETAGILWGSSIFLALLTAPDLVDRLARAVGQVMVHLHDRFRQWVGRELLPDGFSHQHGSIIRGNLLLRCDSNVMISPEMYASQVFKHDRAVLNAVGGGSFHSCGCWKHNIPTIMTAEEVGSLDFGTAQTHMYDMDAVYRTAKQYRKHLHLVTVSPEDLSSGCAAKRFPTGVTLLCMVDDAKVATELMKSYVKNSQS